MGFDQLMAIYARYRVLSAVVNVQPVASTNLDTSIVFWCGIVFSDSATFALGPSVNSTNLNTFLEQKKLPFVMLSSSSSNNALATNQRRNVSRVFKPKEVIGKQYYDGLGFTGTDSANPAEKAYAHIVVASNVPGTDTNNVQLMVSIDFIAQFTTPHAPMVGS